MPNITSLKINNIEYELLSNINEEIETLTNRIDQLTTQLTTLQNRFTPYEITSETTYGELYDHLIETGYPIVRNISVLNVGDSGGYDCNDHQLLTVANYQKYTNSSGAILITILLFYYDFMNTRLRIFFGAAPSTQKISEGIGAYDQFLID